MSAFFLLLLDDRLAGHLTLALELYRQRLRDDALAMPDELAEIQRQVTISARAGRERTRVAAQQEAAHPAPVAQRLLLTEDEAAETFRVSARTVRRLVASGQLQAVKLHGSKRYRRADVEAYVAGLGPPTSMAAHIVTKTTSNEGAA